MKEQIFYHLTVMEEQPRSLAFSKDPDFILDRLDRMREKHIDKQFEVVPSAYRYLFTKGGKIG